MPRVNPSETTDGPTSRPGHRDLLVDVAVVVVLTVVAWLVRRSGLGPSSLWLDDAWVALVHRVDAFPDVWRMGLTSPGFAVVLKVWLDGVGLTSTSAQAIPFVAGTLTPGAVYAVGRRLGLRRVTASAAGALLVFAPAHATYSTRVKQYALDGLLVVGLLWLALRASERPALTARWRALAVSASIATVMSTTVVPAAAAITVGALLPSLRARFRDLGGAATSALRSGPVAWVAGYLAFALLWGVWMVGARLSDRLNEYWSGYYIEGWADLPRVARALVEGLTGSTHGGIILLLFVLWLAGGVLAVRHRLRDAALLWGAPAAALVLALPGTVPLGTGRTELYLYPLLALALAWTVDRLLHRLGRPAYRDAVGLVVLGALLVLLLPAAEVRYPQQDLRPLIEEVDRRFEPEDRVLLSPGAAYATALYGPWTAGIRHNDAPLGFGPRFTWRVTVIRVSGDTENLERRYGGLPEGTRIWLLSSHVVEERLDRARDVLRGLGYQPTNAWSRPGAGLELWIRGAASATGAGDGADREQRLAERGPPAVLDAA